MLKKPWQGGVRVPLLTLILQAVLGVTPVCLLCSLLSQKQTGDLAPITLLLAK